ncbi:ABC transporter substrate-binding protein [Bradyrhizobium septentrionale]|uniref:ABC transporter substrate-binding protein n=1 Tax=Bradyrhizobium septentrionale TaxID=1404411 RepID=A0A974A5N4_9BRAD|nr:ABC transporter substrate-binding protein [Bradyrhizobium septentrionale]UGY17238.1 ABC transporter substrate-binding protein [Bradyrhizobium septentrionale]UGY25982.1 ABC transporter substrate-binding protein [Bradyrhizobium septentrionale]
MEKLRLRTVLGNHPHIKAVKNGELRSELFDLDFTEFTPTNAAFKPMVREQAFDVCEMAIVTYLMARAHGKPLVLLPAAMVGRFQHGHALYRADRGTLTPADLDGKRVGIRSFTTTTGAWMRGILANDYGVDLDRIDWVTFEDPHVAEYVDRTERAPKGSTIIQMLKDGELDAVLGETSSDPALKPLFADPAGEATRWYARHRVVPVNHLVVVTKQLATSRPDVVRSLYELLKRSKARAGPPAVPDLVPFGVEANRRPLELMIGYCAQQALIPRRVAVDELFDDTTRDLN